MTAKKTISAHLRACIIMTVYEKAVRYASNREPLCMIASYLSLRVTSDDLRFW